MSRIREATDAGYDSHQEEGAECLYCGFSTLERRCESEAEKMNRRVE
jgi:hypothetical protein